MAAPPFCFCCLLNFTSVTVSDIFSVVVIVGSSCSCWPFPFAFCFWPLLPDSATVFIRDENSFIAQEATSPPTTPAAAPFHTEGLRRLFLQLYSMIHLKGRVRDEWIGANPAWPYSRRGLPVASIMSQKVMPAGVTI